MKDRAGNELNVDDRVLYLTPGTSTSWLRWGTVVGFTAKMVRVKDDSDNFTYRDPILRNPSSVVKPAKE